MTTRKFPQKAPLQEIKIVRREDQTEDLSLMWLENLKTTPSNQVNIAR